MHLYNTGLVIDGVANSSSETVGSITFVDEWTIGSLRSASSYDQTSTSVTVTGRWSRARGSLIGSQICELSTHFNEVTWTNAANAGCAVAITNASATAQTVTVHGTLTGNIEIGGGLCFGDVFVGVQPRWRPAPLPLPQNHRRQPIRSHTRGTQFSDASPAEITALQLLRQMVSQADFRHYLRHGFVSVRGDSGLIYQVDRKQRISVWDRGERVASLCVHLRGRTLPPTDEVVAKVVMIECDEADIWKRANVMWYAHRKRSALEQLGLAA